MFKVVGRGNQCRSRQKQHVLESLPAMDDGAPEFLHTPRPKPTNPCLETETPKPNPTLLAPPNPNNRVLNPKALSLPRFCRILIEALHNAYKLMNPWENPDNIHLKTLNLTPSVNPKLLLEEDSGLGVDLGRRSKGAVTRTTFHRPLDLVYMSGILVKVCILLIPMEPVGVHMTPA